MLKLVVLNKDATFRLQTSTGLLNLAVLHKDTTLRLLIFFQGVKIAGQCMAARMDFIEDVL